MLVVDFKIVIKGKKVPVNINNEIIDFMQDDAIQNNHLTCEIFFQKILIGRGIILDFYKEFEILQDFNQNLFTHILTFEYKDREYQKYTYFGKKLYEMKYLKNPPIQQVTRESYLDEIISHFHGYIKYLKENYSNLNITFIPSNSNIPEDISTKLSVINTIPLKTVISKNSLVSSKSMTTLSEQQFNKYSIDLSQSNPNDTFILIDDVMGTSASLCETVYKLYNFNKKVNFFFIPVKDVKR
ncbi:hypothetical protein [Aliarcobacter butzleri]|uniref:hypothetical protein n=1 Tax=Aliarcobacter butzleri TaxID=28197 RepID=UPI001EDC803A|nr:hypothetical protein [Aliarcobacter butzleri]MCG3693493.1 hypothetical protein [Aliarcobacter butzleri]